MTRDEALKMLAGKFKSGPEFYSEFVDSLVALGLLKLDQPKSAVDRFCNAYHGHGCAQSIGPSIQSALDKANLKIVEK